MEYILPIWFLFGIITGVVASNKGLSVGLWLVVGFLFGPFGLILSLVVRKDDAAMEQQALQRGAMRKCTGCAELVRAAATKCRYCGTALEPLKQEAARELVSFRTYTAEEQALNLKRNRTVAFIIAGIAVTVVVCLSLALVAKHYLR